MRGPKLACEANALVRIRRGHADIGHDDIWPDALDGRPKLVQVRAGRDEIDIPDPVENPRDALACEKAVVAEDNPNHRATEPRAGLTPNGQQCGVRAALMETTSSKDTADVAL
jgi:hypothetical protein